MVVVKWLIVGLLAIEAIYVLKVLMSKQRAFSYDLLIVTGFMLFCCMIIGLAVVKADWPRWVFLLIVCAMWCAVIIVRCYIAPSDKCEKRWFEKFEIPFMLVTSFLSLAAMTSLLLFWA